MKLPTFLSALLLTLAAGLATPICAQDSAPSSHLVFDDDFAGDIVINEVRVPKSGEATYTYYEALGWRGPGAGYAGIQAHPKSHLFIFSIWDHKSHAAPIRAVHRGPGTETVGFGGEGTGLKSWNFTLGWQTDVWYTLVARAWPVGDHTYFGFWSRAGDTQRWTHLVTMDVAARASFEGATDAFLEDWSNTGARPRATHLRDGWKRRTDGTWFPFGAGRYSVNAWDLTAGKRSFNFRTNWNGGIDRDATGAYYFMVSGGAETKPATTNPARFTLARTEQAPDFQRLALRGAKAAFDAAGRTCTVAWEVEETSAPPFGYRVEIFDNREGRGKPLAVAERVEPHARAATLDLPPPVGAGGGRFARVQLTDLLDRPCEPLWLPVGAAE